MTTKDIAHNKGSKEYGMSITKTTDVVARNGHNITTTTTTVKIMLADKDTSLITKIIWGAGIVGMVALIVGTICGAADKDVAVAIMDMVSSLLG